MTAATQATYCPHACCFPAYSHLGIKVESVMKEETRIARLLSVSGYFFFICLKTCRVEHVDNIQLIQHKVSGRGFCDYERVFFLLNVSAL